MKALGKNDTWEIIVRWGGKKSVGCKWTYTVKHKPGGTLDLYKEIIVEKGYIYTCDIDYEDTFWLVAIDEQYLNLIISCILL